MNSFDKFRRFVYFALPSLVLSGCATLAPPPYSWQNDHLTGEAAGQQFPIDNGACTAAAYRSIGSPPQEPAAPSSHGSVTNFTASTSSGESISGQATTSRSGGLYGAPAGAEEAQRQIQYQNASQQYSTALRSVYVGCMAQRGWTLQPSGQQQYTPNPMGKWR
jgi:hypothetical protein